VPVFDSSYKSKAPTPPQSPTDNKPPRAGGSKETKIPVYSPLKKKGDKSSEPLSRSTYHAIYKSRIRLNKKKRSKRCNT
jgi:hypothetical protein